MSLRQLTEVTDLVVDCAFKVIWQLCICVVGSGQLPHLVAVVLLSLDRNVLHVDVRLHGDDLHLEGNKET